MRNEFKVKGFEPCSFEAQALENNRIGITINTISYEFAYEEFTRSEVEQIVKGLNEILEGME